MDLTVSGTTATLARLGVLAFVLAQVLANAAAEPQTRPMTTRPAVKAEATKGDFGKMRDGRAVDVFILKNRNGITAKVISYGARLAELDVPDKDGRPGNVVLGYENIGQYESSGGVYGAVIGRTINRISGGRFTLDGKEYKLTSNIHGGREGFSRRLWQGRAVETADGPSVVLKYTSADGEEGYPGKLECAVTYTLTNQNELKIAYTATTDHPTIVNLSNHSYFNLAGAGHVRKHILSVNADRYLLAANLIPTGAFASVEALPALDFRKPKEIGQDIDKVNGYDHCYVLKKAAGEMGLAARVFDPSSGRIMEVLTDQPGMQLYTAPRAAAVCLETQHYPDAVHRPEFPPIVLRPGEKYATQTVFRFSLGM